MYFHEHQYFVFRYRLDPVSIKVMLPKNTLDATYECKAKFQREVNLISRIKHQNIVKVLRI